MDSLEASIDAARQTLRSRTDATRAVLAYDGYVTIEGTRYDAVYVEGHEAGQPTSIVLCQRYEPKKRFRSFRTIGNPGHAGDTEPLLVA